MSGADPGDLEALPLCLQALRRLTLRSPLIIAAIDASAAAALASLASEQLPAGAVVITPGDIGAGEAEMSGDEHGAVPFDLVSAHHLTSDLFTLSVSSPSYK